MEINEKGLGRVPAIDFRDNRFLLSPPKFTAIERHQRHWITAKALDQGEKPHCVAFAGTQFLLSAPVKNLPFSTPAELYAECQKADEWEGENYDGTSVRALFKVLQSRGYISRYEWAFDVDTLTRHVLATAPAVIGVSWHAGMLYPDRESFIQAKGNVVGGHAVMVSGVNLKKKCPDGSLGAFRIMNSWSGQWGQKGKCWISIPDMKKLISDFGEICCATEIKFKAEK
jgi:hypothetical protein